MPFIWKCDLCKREQATTLASGIPKGAPQVLVLDDGTGKEQEVWLCQDCWEQNRKAQAQG